MKWVRRIVVLIVLVGICVGAGAWYVGREKSATQFRTESARRGDLLVTISANGTVEPEEVVDVGSQVAGQILAFGVGADGKQIDYGSVVQKDKLLAQIDDTVYKSELGSARAQLAESNAAVQRAQADLLQMKAKLFQAQRDWERAQKLGSSEALAQSAYDQYQAGYETAKANVAVGEAAIIQAQSQIQQSQANVERAERNLGYCTINSPVDGVIIDRRVNIGQTVVASLNAPSLFLIAKDLRRMLVWVPVNEADIGRVQTGQPVSFYVDAFPEITFHGTVSKIRLNAMMTSNVVTYTVEVVTENTDNKLLPYLTANVKFETARRDEVLLVPNAALRWQPTPEQMAADANPTSAPTSEQASAGGPPTGRRHRRAAASQPDVSQEGTVWVQAGDRVKPIKVKIGLTDGIDTEVLGNSISDDTQLVVGEIVPGETPPAGSTNPFLPQFRRRTGGR